MKYLFLFAHPDDETAACACTIKQLVEAGEEVMVVSATDGSAGEVSEEVRPLLKKLGSVSALRKYELEQVAQYLNVHHLRVLDFPDGQITNEMVWGSLKEAFIEVIDEFQPQVVITFDHSGWYFHLDHVGVSIAVTRAVEQAAHRVDALVFSFIRPDRSQWRYVYNEHLPITHTVAVGRFKKVKLDAIQLHKSQSLRSIKARLEEGHEQAELYQLVSATDQGKKIFAAHPVFRQYSLTE